MNKIGKVCNGYPKTLVNRIFHGADRRTPQPSVGADNGDKKYFKLIYVPQLSQRMVNVMRTTSSTIVSYYKKTVKCLFSRLKNDDPDFRKSGVVYKVDCEDCDESWRNFKEMLFIKKHPFSVNARTDIGSLNIAYSKLINEIQI
ncbi:uncharacterized protein LOC123307704 [Coccinella septempunctata]|uniref:uncharacterized protein LOC123307704 n=1 Tax=Coccinella septempunctata TaxID=41139 RepID=UPI001D05DE63|nr:uncharacterized protein LOC123307704 [Coccinella septempunctata]